MTTESKPIRNVLVGELAGQVLGPGLYVLPGQGNSIAIETDAGVVVLDASGPRHVEGMLAMLREHTQQPVHAIVRSQSGCPTTACCAVVQRPLGSRSPTPALLCACSG